MFAQWAAPGTELPGGYSFAATSEPYSLALINKDEPLAWIVSGRQIVTRERLEVLTAGAFPAIADGQPLVEVLQALAAAGALAIIPWGAGKWLGSRGRLVEKIAASAPGAGIFPGRQPGPPGFLAGAARLSPDGESRGGPYCAAPTPCRCRVKKNGREDLPA